MEHQSQIQYVFTSEHQLIGEDGQLFTEIKEKKSSEELQDVVHEMHTQQIGDDKFLTMKLTLDKNGQPLTDEPTIETSKDMDIESFKAEWESGWNPMLHQETEPTGFFSHLKKLKFW